MIFLSEDYTITHKRIKVILKAKYFSITTDGWTCFANVGYVTCTAHFINQETWTLCSIVMGLFDKSRGSTPDDVVNYSENQLTLFALSYGEAVSIVRAYYDCSRTEICTKESKRMREIKMARMY